jgi:Fic family protein
MKAARDRRETVSMMEPLLFGDGSKHRPELTDLTLELAAKSAGLRRSLPESLLASLADLVRAMNCYYSNLIEGHDTHPVDIERALKGDYSGDAKKRNLQLEAKAHISVQQWIDNGGLNGRPVAADSILEIHRRFCAELPEDLLWVEDPATRQKLKVIPGELRRRDVVVVPSRGKIHAEKASIGKDQRAEDHKKSASNLRQQTHPAGRGTGNPRS